MKISKHHWLAAGLALAGSALMLGSALAHHSFAMFDRTKKVSVTGTVRTFEWSNPHVWLWINSVNGKGEQEVWGFEGAAPGEMARLRGWTRNTFVKGDKVIVEAAPLKDGRTGGSMGKVTRPDGTVIGGTGGEGLGNGAQPGTPPAKAPAAPAGAPGN
jgi:hypothetical protein